MERAREFKNGTAGTMNLIFFMPRRGNRGDELVSAVAPLVSKGSLELFPDIRSFGNRLRRPKDAHSIALIWDPTAEDLREIVSMRDLLTGVRTVLALPDESAETVALAHKILPAFISYVDDGLFEVVSVLERLTGSGGEGPPEGAQR
jgi:hypothetical protein